MNSVLLHKNVEYEEKRVKYGQDYKEANRDLINENNWLRRNRDKVRYHALIDTDDIIQYTNSETDFLEHYIYNYMCGLRRQARLKHFNMLSQLDKKILYQQCSGDRHIKHTIFDRV